VPRVPGSLAVPGSLERVAEVDEAVNYPCPVPGLPADSDRLLEEADDRGVVTDKVMHAAESVQGTRNTGYVSDLAAEVHGPLAMN